jgi:hypothetical protein
MIQHCLDDTSINFRTFISLVGKYGLLRTGVQLRRPGPPIERLTVAPTPIFCSMANIGDFASFRTLYVATVYILCCVLGRYSSVSF